MSTIIEENGRTTTKYDLSTGDIEAILLWSKAVTLAIENQSITHRQGGNSISYPIGFWVTFASNCYIPDLEDDDVNFRHSETGRDSTFGHDAGCCKIEKTTYLCGQFLSLQHDTVADPWRPRHSGISYNVWRTVIDSGSKFTKNLCETNGISISTTPSGHARMFISYASTFGAAMGCGIN